MQRRLLALKVTETRVAAVVAAPRPKAKEEVVAAELQPRPQPQPPEAAEAVASAAVEIMAVIHVNNSRPNHRRIRNSNHQDRIKVEGGETGEDLVHHPTRRVVHLRNHQDRTHISSAQNVMPSPCHGYSTPKRTISISYH